MKLCKYSLDGLNGVDLSTGGLDLGGNAAYRLEVDTVPSGYVQVNDIKSWGEYCRLFSKDYKFLRDSLKVEVVPGWATLSASDQKFLVGMYAYPVTFTQADIDVLFSAAEQLKNWESLVEGSTGSRIARWYAAARVISFYLTPAHSFDLYSTVKVYSDLYQDTGSPHLLLWVTNGAAAAYGIDFTVTGFTVKVDYYSDAKRDLLVDIIQNGNY